MASPCNGSVVQMSSNAAYPGPGNTRCGYNPGCALQLEKQVLAGCDRLSAHASCSSMPESLMTSFESENGSSFMWQRTSTRKGEADGLETPMGMLRCEDTLDDEDDDEDTTREWAPGRPSSLILGSTYHHSDTEETICNELMKEAELGPFTPTPLQPDYRGILVQWMRDVCSARNLSPATFFSSVSLLDRFLRATGEGATPPTLLQLVALTCVAVSAKSEQQQCAGELLSLARDENGNLYKCEDSRMMEIHLLDTLAWRLRTPTVYTFTSLFLHRVMNRPEDGQVVPPGMKARFRQLVQRLAELAVMDYELTSVSYSALAVACLLVAETEIKGGHMHDNLKTVESIGTIPALRDMPNLSAPVQRLYFLYKTLASQGA